MRENCLEIVTSLQITVIRWWRWITVVVLRLLTVNKAIYYSNVSMWDCHTSRENAQTEVIKGWMLCLCLCSAVISGETIICSMWSACCILRLIVCLSLVMSLFKWINAVHAGPFKSVIKENTWDVISRRKYENLCYWIDFMFKCLLIWW